MKYLKESIRSDQAWNEAMKAYKAHYASIEKLLAPSVRAFHDIRWLHDEVVNDISVERDELIVELDWARLLFYGVRRYRLPSEIHDNVWLYDEVDTAPGGCFELRVLFGEGELKVVAKTVGVQDMEKGTWIVDPWQSAPSTAQSTKKRGKKRR